MSIDFPLISVLLQIVSYLFLFKWIYNLSKSKATLIEIMNGITLHRDTLLRHRLNYEEETSQWSKDNSSLREELKAINHKVFISKIDFHNKEQDYKRKIALLTDDNKNLTAEIERFNIKDIKSVVLDLTAENLKYKNLLYQISISTESEN